MRTFALEQCDIISTIPCKLEKPRFCQVPSPLTVSLRSFDPSHASSIAFFIELSLCDSNTGSTCVMVREK